MGYQSEQTSVALFGSFRFAYQIKQERTDPAWLSSTSAIDIEHM